MDQLPPYKTEHPLYSIWDNAKKRCYCSSGSGYHYYGGRGIKMCDRWRNDFWAFVEDIGPRPSPKHSLDRIDSDGDYCPENCRWATPREQSKNQSRIKMIHVGGLFATRGEWARISGINKTTLRRRLKNSWDFIEAIKTPPLPRGLNIKSK